MKHDFEAGTARGHTTLKLFEHKWEDNQEVFMFPVRASDAVEHKACQEEDRTQFAATLTHADKDKLAVLWHVRCSLEKKLFKGARTMIWKECERRYGNCRTPFNLEFTENNVKVLTSKS